jgi:hypothetical protein
VWIQPHDLVLPDVRRLVLVTFSPPQSHLHIHATELAFLVSSKTTRRPKRFPMSEGLSGMVLKRLQIFTIQIRHHLRRIAAKAYRSRSEGAGIGA